MKTLCIHVLILLLTFSAFAQKNNFGEFFESGRLPEVVLKQAGEEFSVYYPDAKNSDSRIAEIEKTFISYDLGKDFEGYESYLLLFKIDNGYLAAEFNEKGKLLSVVEKFKNSRLPEKVRISLAEKFPDWKLIKDRYLYVQKDGSVTRKEYKIIMQKDNKIRRVIVNDKGDILRGKS